MTEESLTALKREIQSRIARRRWQVQKLETVVETLRRHDLASDDEAYTLAGARTDLRDLERQLAKIDELFADLAGHPAPELN